MSPLLTFSAYFLGASGWVTAIVALRAESHQFRERFEADRIAAWAREAGACARTALERQYEVARSLRAWARDLDASLHEAQDEVADLSEALADAAMQATLSDGYIRRLVDLYCEASQARRAAQRELERRRLIDSRRTADGNRTKARKRRQVVEAKRVEVERTTVSA